MTAPPTAAVWQPSGPVEFIVGTPPGGGQDRPARTLIRIMQSAGLVGVPMKVSNIPGKGGGNRGFFYGCGVTYGITCVPW